MYYICYTLKEAENCMDDLKIKLTIIIPFTMAKSILNVGFDSIGKQESLQCILLMTVVRITALKSWIV